MNVLTVIVAIPPLMFLSALVLALPMTLLQSLDELIQVRKGKKQDQLQLELWKRLAIEETDPIEKGYKTARLLNLEYEIRSKGK